MGLLTGAAFGLVYTLMGVPIAHWIDRGVNRARLIAVLVAVWSIMTAVCGLARGYGQFFIARMGVGLAESGFSPASQALISDLYTREERSPAMGVFSIGVPIGIMLGMSIGGIIGMIIGGWQGSYFGRKGMQHMLCLPIIGLLLSIPLYLAVLYVPDGKAALMLLIFPTILGAFWTAPAIALTQNLSPVAMRARRSDADCRGQSSGDGVWPGFDRNIKRLVCSRYRQQCARFA